jgi:hypothetical protein
MNSRKIRLLLWTVVTALCILAVIQCQRSGDVRRVGPEIGLPWTLTLAEPINHLDVVAGEPMIVEHPDGTLFVGGFGATFMSGKRRGVTWTAWWLRECPEVAYYAYLVARGRGELAATWFAGWTGTWHARVARIDVGESEAPPRMVESAPFRPDSWQRPNPKWPNDPPLPNTAGEYLALTFLRQGGLAVVSPVKNHRERRFGFSF